MFSRHFEAALRSEANSVVKQICGEKLGAMGRAPLHEVDFVASMIENGVHMLGNSWAHVLGGSVDIRVGGVFTHQSPYVIAQGSTPRKMRTQRCELADLLILHTHQNFDQKVFRRGVLMQTKMDHGHQFTPDDPQFWLYDVWPSFIVDNRSFDRNARDFKRDRRSGRYGLLSQHGWKVAAPSSRMSSHMHGVVDLGDFLVDMLYDMDPAQPDRASQSGRQVYHNLASDWSRTIHELLINTAKKRFAHRAVYPGRMSRSGGGLLLHFGQHEDSLFGGGGGGGGGDVEPDEDDGNGFGILVIETVAIGD